MEEDDGGAEQSAGRAGGSKADRKAAEAAQADRERFIEVSRERMSCVLSRCPVS